jgi:mono/diheme cytochrome c family protein
MMNDEAKTCPMRLADLSLPAKLMLTFFLLLVGCGYLVALLNIYEQHHDADLDPRLSIDDVRRVYHGLTRTVTEEMRLSAPSPMLKMVSPGGKMRRHLEGGGEPAIRALISWLKDGANEATFAQAAVYHPGDPSAQDVLFKHCIRCHNLQGDKSDVPYAPAASSPPEYSMVARFATPLPGPTSQKAQTVHLAPTSLTDLVLTTHLHILAIPLFTLIVGTLFLLTGLPPGVKLVVGPLPMLAVCCDIGSWWLARPFEPFIYVIATAGAVFGAAFGLQVLCVAGSLWFGRRSTIR